MSIDVILTKRRAKYFGEIGFFPEDQVAHDDIAPIAWGKECMVSISNEKNLDALRFLWGLVHKVADNTDMFLDKDEAMDKLKIAAGYSRAVYDPHTRKVEVRPKSLKRISDERLRLLTDRIMDIVCAEILPGMKKNDLRREIEEMLGTTA